MNQPKTDLEAFAAMFTEAKQTVYKRVDNGPTISLIFEILPGVLSCSSTVGEAFFDKQTGKFMGLHGCD